MGDGAKLETPSEIFPPLPYYSLNSLTHYGSKHDDWYNGENYVGQNINVRRAFEPGHFVSVDLTLSRKSIQTTMFHFYYSEEFL